MGYRSDVAIALTKSDYEELAKLAAMQDETTRDFVLEWPKKGEFTTPDETYIALFWGWVKWYSFSEKSEVDFVMDFISERRHSFVRIGEDSNDIEYDLMTDDDNGCDEEFYELLNTSRNITGLRQFGIKTDSDSDLNADIAARAIKAFEEAGNYKPGDPEVLEAIGLSPFKYQELTGVQMFKDENHAA